MRIISRRKTLTFCRAFDVGKYGSLEMYEDYSELNRCTER